MGTKKSLNLTVITNEVTPDMIWDTNKTDKIKEYILSESKKQPAETKLKIELLSIKYQMQAYIKNETIEKEMRVLDFVKLYLKSLKITQKDLAHAFEMKAGNLYKYLNGERKLNPDVVLKLSAFSHTQPELWYYIQTKNELYELKKQKTLTQYEKYDYENFVVAV